MRSSNDRILTAHVGRLPRSMELTALLLKRDAGAAVDESELKALVQASTLDTVQKQTAAGIDIVNDGEQPRARFSTQIVCCLSGFGARSTSRRRQATDYSRFPGFAEYCVPPANLHELIWSIAAAPSLSSTVNRRARWTWSEFH